MKADGSLSGRRHAAYNLLKPQQFRESIALAGQPSLRNSSLAGLQAAATVAIALPLVSLSSWSHLIGFASLGSLVALFGRFAPEAKREWIVLLCAICQTLAVFFMSLATWVGLPLPGQLLLLALSAGIFSFITVTGKFGPPGALIFIFAAGASMTPVASLHVVFERTAATAIVSALACLICALTEKFRHQASPEKPFPSEPSRPTVHRLIAAGRISLGAAIAALTAYALGAIHPAWAAMGTVAVMQGAHLHISMNRALQRMAGTLLGALITWLVLAQGPSLWCVIAILAGLQFATEVIIGSNYALGQILVTPMALLMTYLAMPGVSHNGIISERILDTFLGAALAVIFAVICSNRDDRIFLAQHRARK
ncbi:FUSC family protein [Brucella anthropi]|jgi:Fusaric acid resistance protein-like|uniref:FUSC family protein n=1 Tax=Brucella anthropi TaxID=529 RepID=A0A011V0M8_BRUAN|nr:MULTISPECIES: FUSC family protein [Brucella/Ochrobactrum group]QOD66064.1 FUSC family protein [Ochrobactrum sp. MT180101]QTN04360.1 FUSC family protein [Ochrobactrum sp. EEELCW01]EXL01975.1 fusaric acid resistance protein [Brucella anthropi]KAB2731791.1 FUSC family protein [Brucella anthropi]KAB2754901.1 FUSC family protein [Brucella anthropi]